MTSPEPPSTHSGRTSPFAEPVFRRYFLAMCFSTMGTWVTRFLIGWSAWELTHAALWVGIASAVMLLPTFVLSPVFGVLADRINPRNGLMVTLTSQALLGALAATTMALGLFSLTPLLIVALATGAIAAAHSPLRLTLIPLLVSRSALPGAIGISAMVFNLARILGPALAGALLAGTGGAVTFGVGAGLFAGSALAIRRVRCRDERVPPARSPVWQQFREGLSFSIAQPVVRLTLLLTLVNGLLGRTVIELLPALSGRLLAGDAATLAVLTAAAGAGSILGGLAMTRLSGSESVLSPLVFGCLTVAALVLLPAPLAGGIASVAAIVLVLSLVTTVAGTGCQALTMLGVPDNYRGRVLSLWTVLTMGSPAIGSLVMGALADRIGFAPVLVGFGLATLLVVTWLWRGRQAAKQG
ncbi:MFS transporter [Parahaliea aestuarii]|uniref:MFS transporter n=1 Tax=Parahaliea aestuarii TaxID=1852021 RepID=A0A5C9A0S8_9GAMM|nr:MFS transporter [Parahaliea aestuarii]TXS93492.1 MFS transporter [Parahaliea aestuarii]